MSLNFCSMKLGCNPGQVHFFILEQVIDKILSYQHRAKLAPIKESKIINGGNPLESRKKIS